MSLKKFSLINLINYISGLKKEEDSSDFIKKVLFITYDNIGDMIIATPIFRVLKENYPNIEIAVTATKKNRDVLKYNRYISKIFIFEHNDKISISKINNLIKMRNENFDILIDFWKKISIEIILRVWLINAKKNYTAKKINYYEKKHSIKTRDLKVYSSYFGNTKNKHFWKSYFDSLKIFDINRPQEIYYEIIHSNLESKKIEKTLFKNGKYILINISAGNKSRTLSFALIKKILDTIDKKAKEYFVILIASKKDRLKLEKIREYRENIIIIETDTINEVSAVVEKSELIITPDTSVVHIASSMNKKILAFYIDDKGNYKRFSPISEKFEVCFYKKHKMGNLKPFFIEEKLEKLI